MKMRYKIQKDTGNIKNINKKYFCPKVEEKNTHSFGAL